MAHMAKDTKRRPRDVASRAWNIVQEAIGEEEKYDPEGEHSEVRRKAGRKGGKARASKLTAEQRREIAKKAAEARWGKSD